MDKEYKGWEIIKMLSEKALKVGQKLEMTYAISIDTVEVSEFVTYRNETFQKLVYENSDKIISFNKLVACTFTIPKEYMTFDEARKTGKKFKHKTWTHSSYMTLKQVMEKLYFMSDDINQLLDEKAWEVEE